MSVHSAARIRGVALLLIVVAGLAGACGKKKPPVARPMMPPSAATPTQPPAPPQPISEPSIVAPEPVPSDTVGSRSIDDLNRDSPFRPVFFELDSADITPDGQAAVQANATLMRQYMSWTVTIEGHCDERGTAEYNLALGERRAVAARNYLVSLGIAADRFRIVSYGKEFPFDPEHTDEAWARNRRAHFVITGK